MRLTARLHRHAPHGWLALIAMLGLLLTATSYNVSQRHETARMQAHFNHLAHDRALRLQSSLNQALTVLTTAQGLFDASEQVTRTEFHLMVSPALARHPDIMAINWAPRVRQQERQAYENEQRQEGLATLGIYDVSPDASQPRRANERAEYFPVTFSAPFDKNRTAIGIDPYARPQNRQAMDQAVRHASQWSTQPFPVVQDPNGPLAVAIYQPVYRHGWPLTSQAQRQGALRGFLILLLQPGISLENELANLSPVGLDIRLIDTGQKSGVIHHRSGGLPGEDILPGEPLCGDFPLYLPGRKLTLQVTATRAFHDHAGSREPITVLIAGLALSSLMVMLFWAHTRQSRRIEQSELALRESESRFRELAEHLDAVFWINTPDWQQVIYISPAYERIWGRSADRLYQYGMDWFDALHEADRKAILELIPGKEQTEWQFIQFPPYRIRRPDGSQRWISARAYSIRNETGQIVRVAGIAEDISEHHTYQQHLEDLAHYDPLTRLPNRRLLADRLNQALARSQRTGQLLAICMLDLDGFKPVNDQFGHEIGDQLLIEVAHRLQDSVRSDDTVARLGGDEFVILLGGLSSVKELEEALRRVLQTLASVYVLAEHPITISASIGVTFSPSDSSDADTLLRHADHAMYLAKEAGKNRFILFNPVLEERERDNRSALELIRKSVDSDQLRLFYQPIVDCRRGLVVGMEALLRWEHPILGLMKPAEFLPLVESDDNLARNVGTWVLRNAIKQAEIWRQTGLNIPVSINVFVQQLRDARFPELLQNLLAEHPDLPASRICIEILESTALDDFASVIRLIRTCSSQGVRFSLDDFGTGFSSLTYLRRLPVDSLKIDQSFVRDMLHDPDDLTIVEGVIGLSTAFRHQVVAEGVESTDMALMLMEMGCHLVQGYGIAKPMSGEATLAWINDFKPDPRWLENAAQRLSRDDFQLVLAEVNHRQWLASLQNWTRLEPEHRGMPPPLDGHECNFGHWYYGEGEKRYGHLLDYQIAEVLHDRIHRLAQQMVRQIETSAVFDSRETEAELLATAEEFRDILTRIRASVKHPDAGQ